MIHIKKALLKTLAVSVCAALAAGGAYALAPEKPADTEKVTKETTSVAAASEDTGAVKDETVYVLAGADGSVQKIIVSDWLKNTLGAQQLSDSTTLSDIENVKGDESFASGSWDAQGNDIYYQGNSDQELPVSMKVTYKLDGKMGISRKIEIAHKNIHGIRLGQDTRDNIGKQTVSIGYETMCHIEQCFVFFINLKY